MERNLAVVRPRRPPASVVIGDGQMTKSRHTWLGAQNNVAGWAPQSYPATFMYAWYPKHRPLPRESR